MGNGDSWIYKEGEWKANGRPATRELHHFQDYEILELSIEEYEQLIRKTDIKQEDFWQRFEEAYRSRYSGT